MGAYRSVLRNLVRLCGVLAVGRGYAGKRLLRRTSTVLALSVAALFALCVGAAWAEPPKLVSYGNFSVEGALGVAVDNSCVLQVPPLANVPCEAFDPSDQDVYTAGLLSLKTYSPESVEKFSGAGERISPSPFGLPYNGGAAVNPTNGQVDVLNGATNEVDTYDPLNGTLVGKFPVPPFGSIGGLISYGGLGIAAEAKTGNVYVPIPVEEASSPTYENVILEYSPTGTLLKEFKGSPTSPLSRPTGVAVDSSGDVWIADHGNNRIVELGSSGTPVKVNGKPVEIKSEGVESIALDERGDVLATDRNNVDPCGSVQEPCGHLVEYTLAGVQVADVGAGFFGAKEGAIASMVAANDSNGRVYVSDLLKGLVWIFGPPTAPIVGRELTSEVTTSEAKLGALVNPGGAETSYRFEYGTSTEYGQSTPYPDGSVGEGVTARTVWAAASGLAPGTTYHYRVVATNEVSKGPVYGPDQTFTTQTAEQAACPNQQLRSGFSARLPDCRAYELVTAPVKTSVQFDAGSLNVHSSTSAADGEAVTLFTKEPLPGAPTGGVWYVGMRGAGGWSVEDIEPMESYLGVLCSDFKHVEAYSNELTRAVIEVGDEQSRASRYFYGTSESCGTEGLQVVSGEPVGYQNLLVRDNATGTYRLVNTLPPGVTPADATFQGASADLSHVVFTEQAPLAEGAQYGVENLYEWDEGALRLVSWLPDNTPVLGSLAAGQGEQKLPVSSNGSHILFTSGGSLYDRIDGEHTIRVDEKQAGAAGPSGGGVLQTASTDGSRVLFLDESKLTVGSTAESKEPDLYECALPEGASKCQLSDLTVAKSGEHADVIGVSLFGSKDSSHVYFIAMGVLASNTREFTNSEGKVVLEGAQAGQSNLYLWSGGTTTFIASGHPEGYETISNGHASPDGTWFAFLSGKSLTSYDNVQRDEIFLYNTATKQLLCASCNPTGEAPTVGAEFQGGRPLADGGRLFFEMGEALVPADTNGQPDVYEYENGQVHLISSGTSSFESNLQGASESGHDVFFRSTQQLVPQDTQEGMYAIYDARVEGGFPAIASPPACTTADACRAPVSPQPAIYGAPSSQTFSGAGNLAAPAGKAVKPRSLTRKQKLRRALSSCHKRRNKRKRSVCERQAKRRYGAKASRFQRSGKANASKRGGK